MRALIAVAVIAGAHFAATFVAGVLAFVTQGDLAGAAPPASLHGIVSGAATILESPLVWLVREISPERLSGFTLAAVCNSVVWGIVAYGGGIALARLRARPP